MTSDDQPVYPRLGGAQQDTLQKCLETGEPHVAFCPDCKYTFYYPRIVCPRCLHDNIELIAYKEPLRVMSHTYVYRVQSPIFAQQSPALMMTVTRGDLQMIVEGHGWHQDSPPSVGSVVRLDCHKRDDQSVVIIARPVDRVNQGE